MCRPRGKTDRGRTAWKPLPEDCCTPNQSVGTYIDHVALWIDSSSVDEVVELLVGIQLRAMIAYIIDRQFNLVR
jgi:hypothetical protein